MESDHEQMQRTVDVRNLYTISERSKPEAKSRECCREKGRVRI
ncbi:unnamed protein product [Brassica oleracea var. botrytis]